MNKRPFFSIVIPCLNEEKHLPNLLNDLVNQNVLDFEVIVVDGESKDKTVEKANSFAKKIPHLKVLTSKIRNVAVQRNLGASKATGQYLLFNDADNRLPKYFLQGIKYHLDKRFADLFTTFILPDSDNNADKAIANYCNLLIETNHLLGTPVALGALIGCHRTIFKDIGGFDPKVGFAEDAEFIRRGYKKGFTFEVFHDPKYIFSFRRFRESNKLNVIRKYAVLNLKFLMKAPVDQKKEYPMGGDHRDDQNSPLRYIHSIEKGVDHKITKPKILDRLKAILSLEEE